MGKRRHETQETDRESAEDTFIRPSKNKMTTKKRHQSIERRETDAEPNGDHDSHIEKEVESTKTKKVKRDEEVHTEVVESPSPDDCTVASNSSSSFQQKADALTTAYGSAKKLRAMRSRHLNRIEGEALDAAMAATLDQAIIVSPAKQVESKSSRTMDTSQESELLPPHNKEASNPQDVYKLKDLISTIEMQAMKENATDLTNATEEDRAKWREQFKYGYFIMNHIQMLPLDGKKRLEAAAKLSYLNIMIKMYQARVQQLQKLPAFIEAPQCVRNKLLQSFTLTLPASQGRPQLLQPKRLKDKLLLHILILAMIVGDYRLQLTELMMDLNLSQKNLTNYLRAIGAQVKKSTETLIGQKVQTLVATIPIPLTFPKVTEMKTKRSY